MQWPVTSDYSEMARTGHGPRTLALQDSGEGEPVIRVVIADDHPVLRLAVRHRLEAEDDIEVLAEAGSGREAVAIVRAVQPDLVILDYQMPNLDGLEAARAIHEALPNIDLVMLTGWEDGELAEAAVRAGVAGFVSKTEPPDRLLETIRSVAGAA